MRLAAFLFGTALSLSATAQAPPVNILTWRNDNQRTGQNLNETILTPSNLSINTFAKAFAHSVDGAVYGQPLYIQNIPVFDSFSGQTINHNVVIVCTAHNTIYAWDADNNLGTNSVPLWAVNFNSSAFNISPVPSEDVFSQDIFPEIGIIGTPVINPATRTLYVVVRTKEGRAYAQRLHAIDLTNGAERPNSPIDLYAQMPIGTNNGYDSIDDGMGGFIIPFDTRSQNQRAALLLLNNVLYIAWASHGNQPTYHGWIMAYNPVTLAQIGYFNTTPNRPSDPTAPRGAGGIWMGGAGLSADAAGDIYLVTGNGAYTQLTGGTEYGETVLKLHPVPGQTGANYFQILDFFTPYNWAALTIADADIGSGGLLLLPDQPGISTPRMMVVAGKEGKIYLINRDTGALGGVNIGFDAVIQSLFNAVGPLYGTPAYFDNGFSKLVYFQGSGDSLKAFSLANGFLSSAPISQQNLASQKFLYPGASPVVSANGQRNGIVWTLENYYPTSPTPLIPNPPPLAVLHAYDATDVSVELYNSLLTGSRDGAGNAVKFTVPTVANGKVYVGGNGTLTVFAPLPPNTPPPPRQADHFLISGPNFTPPPFGPAISQNVGYAWSITAIGPDFNPIKITDTLHIVLRDFVTGGLVPVDSISFNNESSKVWSHTFPQSTVFQLLVFDSAGHSNEILPSIVPPLVVVELSPNPEFSPGGLDHFVIEGPTTVANGSNVTLHVTAVDANGAPVQVYDFVDMPAPMFIPLNVIWYDTVPGSTQDIDPTSPSYAYNPYFMPPPIGYGFVKFGHTDPLLGFVPDSRVDTPTFLISGKGPHIISFTNSSVGFTAFTHSASFVINVQ